MSCRSELRGLVEVDSAIRKKGGQLLALSVDTPEQSRALRDEQDLPYRLLCDPQREVIRAYGLEHHGGGPDGEIIAVPAQYLLLRDGTVAWQFVSRRITQRAAPEVTLAAIATL